MQILTPTGYRDIVDCNVGDQVSAFDIETGAPLVNTIETMQWVDAEEWARWWQVEPECLPFHFYLINETWVLNSEQSIWRNGASVCHAKDLVVGDVLHDGDDNDLTITSIEEVAVDGWWRFDISGDHSYIVDGLTLHNASRFWVGGTGTWDSSTTTHWASSSNGAGGQSVPSSADSVTLDANSGGGTVTPNFGGTITIQSLTMGAFTGTFDNSSNNNNITCSNSSGTFSITGTGTRTITLGSATYTVNANGTWTAATTTNLTFSGASSTIAYATTGFRDFTGGGLTYGTVTVAASAAAAGRLVITGSSSTIGSLSVTAPNWILLPTTMTITAMALNGTSSSQILVQPSSVGNGSTVATGGGSIGSWSGLLSVTFTGSPTLANGFDFGNNSGITITAPSSGGGSVSVIGS